MAKAGLALLVLVSIAVLNPAAGQAAEERNSANLKELSKGIENFSYTILFRSFLDSGGVNLLISPFSVWSMLAMLSQGAGDSITKVQLLSVMNYPLRKSYPDAGEAYTKLSPYSYVNTPTVELDNSIFYRKDIQVNQNFINRVSSTFSTKMTSLDFSAPSAANTINKAVSQATRCKIDEIVNAQDLKESVMILTNAIFFKGQWTSPFNSSETSTVPFFDEQNREAGNVRMMFQRSPLPYANMRNFKSHVVELPYGQENRLSMVIILPHRGVTLSEVLRLTPEIPVATIFASLKQAAEEYEYEEVDIYLPRFKVTSDIILNKVLNEMGIHEVFDPTYADLSNMSSSPNLHLSRVIHKATIEVTEEGTVASAATVGELNDLKIPPKFVANRPFIYLVIEKSTNVILFGGSYVTPSLF